MSIRALTIEMHRLENVALSGDIEQIRTYCENIKVLNDTLTPEEVNTAMAMWELQSDNHTDTESNVFSSSKNH